MACAEKTEWKDKFSDFPPPEQNEIQKALKDHIVEVTSYTLDALGLIPSAAK